MKIKGPKYLDAACGSNFSVVVREDGVFSFGNPELGRLGIGLRETPAIDPMPLLALQVNTRT